MVYDFCNNKNLPNSLVTVLSSSLISVDKHSLSLIRTNNSFTDKIILLICYLVPPQRKSNSLELSRFSYPQQRTSKNNENKFGVPPTPTIEGREKLKALLPSISFIRHREMKASLNARSIKKFGTPQVSNGEESNIPPVVSLLTQSSGLRAAGSSLRGFWH